VRLVATSGSAHPPEAIRARLHAIAGWDFVPGGTVDGVVEGRDGALVELRVETVRTVRVRLEVKRTDDGIAWDLVQGDVSAVSGAIALTADGEGTRIVGWCALTAPVPLPGILVSEIEAGFRELVQRVAGSEARSEA
jgi:hypothetical protein